MRLVVGQISYLNSQPFYPLLLGEHRLIPTPPSELGRMASKGEIDAGILATADYLQCADRYEPVAGLGVANHEEVRSILLASRKPLAELNGAVIGVTEETSTSVRLLKLLLEVRYRLRP
ncbi:MAG TPA: MqnA/MqnD/SBP family protein, partial [Vicinamibacteria bacterium]